jgi:Membrane proteins related to metalloendopeptidases
MMILFKVMVEMSFAGSLLYVLFKVFSSTFRRFFSAQWHRWALCVLLAFFLLPVGAVTSPIIKSLFAWKQMPYPEFMGEIPAPLANFMGIQTIGGSELAQSAPQISIWQLLAVLWIAGMFALLFRKMFAFIRFNRMLCNTNCLIDTGWESELFQQVRYELDIKKHIALYHNAQISSPMLVGLRRTAVILPKIEWTKEKLDYVLRHELTHYKHRDLWLKSFGMLACVLHWLNPCVYLLARALDKWIECDCDAAVVGDMNYCERRSYGMAILSVMGNIGHGKEQGMCAALREEKENMKERLTIMLNTKPLSKKVGVIAAIALAILCTVGVLTGAAVYNPPEPAIETTAMVNANNIDTSTPETANADNAEIPKPIKEIISENEAIEFMWPAGDYEHISSGIDTYPGHTGIDIPCSLGSEIYASAPGIVTLAKKSHTGYGNYIVIDHGNGYQTLYAHCDTLLVEVGDEIASGDLIAEAGRSGWATGYQLHFEIRCDENVLDPEDFVSPDKK